MTGLTHAADANSTARRARPVDVEPRGLNYLNPAQLTPRERDCIRLVIEGKPNRVVAHELGLTEGTVKVYLSRAYKFLRVASRCELMAWWYKSMRPAA